MSDLNNVTSACSRSRETDSIKVLLVDHDRSWSDFVARDLLRRGFQLDNALDGLLAIEMMKSFKPDVIVCDVPMPRMNGVEFVCWLRDQHDPTPVILVDDPEIGIDKSLAQIVGANVLLPKSKSVDLLVEAIKALHKPAAEISKR